MPDRSITLPFSVPDLFVGFAEGTGLAKASSEEVTLRIARKDRDQAEEFVQVLAGSELR
jgi:hypothetical protein